jgi:hypothetical protein
LAFEPRPNSLDVETCTTGTSHTEETSMTSQDVAPIEVTLRGNVGDLAGSAAEETVLRALRQAPAPVRRAHLVLDWLPDPAVERSALAEVGVDVDGRLLRAKAAAPTMSEAVDELDHRLRRQLRQLRERSRARARRDAVAAPGEWRHGDTPRRPSPYFPRAVEDRETVRHKTFASGPMTVDDAAYEMDLLDHDFFLYRDAATRHPMVMRRVSGGGHVVDQDPPRLSDTEARDRLDAAGEPFVFHLASEGGTPRVLYRRYDGNYGLIELTD